MDEKQLPGCNYGAIYLAVILRNHAQDFVQSRGGKNDNYLDILCQLMGPKINGKHERPYCNYSRFTEVVHFHF